MFDRGEWCWKEKMVFVVGVWAVLLINYVFLIISGAGSYTQNSLTCGKSGFADGVSEKELGGFSWGCGWRLG